MYDARPYCIAKLESSSPLDSAQSMTTNSYFGVNKDWKSQSEYLEDQATDEFLVYLQVNSLLSVISGMNNVFDDIVIYAEECGFLISKESLIRKGFSFSDDDN